MENITSWVSGVSSLEKMLLNAFIFIFGLFFVFLHKIPVFIIFISFFEETSNFRNRILTNQKYELLVSNFQRNCMLITNIVPRFYHKVTANILNRRAFLWIIKNECWPMIMQWTSHKQTLLLLKYLYLRFLQNARKTRSVEPFLLSKVQVSGPNCYEDKLAKSYLTET